MAGHFKKVFNNHCPINFSVLEELEQREIISSLGNCPLDTIFGAALRKITNGKIQAGKGKDYSYANNWRGICLAKIPAKIQSSIISSRLLSHLEKVRIETQEYGCVPGKGCTNALFAIKMHSKLESSMGKIPGQSSLIWSKRLTLLTTNSYS
eukprot:scaffold20224_cov53-Attheya_sp.AAC.2